MTKREKNLLAVLAGIVLVVGVSVLTSNWFDEVNRLNGEHETQRAYASRLMQTDFRPPQGESPTAPARDFESRLWSGQGGPTILEFSAQITEAAKSAGLGLAGLQVLEKSEGTGWIQIQSTAPIERILAFLSALTVPQKKVLFRQCRLKSTGSGTYTLVCEVGYATRP